MSVDLARIVAGDQLAHVSPVVNSAKRFVYVLRGVRSPERRYIGLAADMPARLKAHNAGQNPSTARWRPWSIDVSIEFRTEGMAVRFERYLKSGSGHAFASRHFRDE
jgi:putative endonuclease